MKSQINIRASALLQNQLDILTTQLGTSITETVSIAIDRMYQQEIAVSKKYSRRQHIIEKIAERIYAAQWDNEQVRAANNHGFTFDIRFQDGEYIGDSWSQVTDMHLTADELEEAKLIATKL